MIKRLVWFWMLIVTSIVISRAGHPTEASLFLCTAAIINAMGDEK